MDPHDDGNTQNETEPGTTTASGPSKPLTVTISEDLLRKLRVVAVLKDQSMSSLVEAYLGSQMRRDLKKLMGKLEE